MNKPQIILNIKSLYWLTAYRALVLHIQPIPQALLVKEMTTTKYHAVVVTSLLKTYLALV